MSIGKLAAGKCCLTLVLLAGSGIPAAAQHEGAKHDTAAERASESPSQGEHGSLELWKWANFLLLAGILGWAIAKNAGPFFSARSRQIRKDMVEAQELRQEAEAKAADVDRRLANLEASIEALREEARQEQSAEEERIRRQTAVEIAKVQRQAEQEIESAGKAARLELKRYSAQLAVALAEQKIRARMTPDAQDNLVRGFVRGLDKPEPPVRTP